MRIVIPSLFKNPKAWFVFYSTFSSKERTFLDLCNGLTTESIISNVSASNRTIQSTNNNSSSAGLCHVMFFGSPMIKAFTHLWPKFTGNHLFPVPHDYLEPKKAFRNSYWSDGLYNKETQYGRDRLELAQFLTNRAVGLLQRYEYKMRGLV